MTFCIRIFSSFLHLLLVGVNLLLRTWGLRGFLQGCSLFIAGEILYGCGQFIIIFIDYYGILRLYLVS